MSEYDYSSARVFAEGREVSPINFALRPGDNVFCNGVIVGVAMESAPADGMVRVMLNDVAERATWEPPLYVVRLPEPTSVQRSIRAGLERFAWERRICAGIDAAARKTPITAADLRARNGWRVSWRAQGRRTS